MRTSPSRRQRGSSLLEMTVVASIAIVLAAIAAPNFMNVISNARLRGAATSLSGLIQNARIQAIKKNQTQTVLFTTINMGPYAYVKVAGGSTTLTSMDPQVQLGAPIIKVDVPAGSTPTPLDSTQLGFTAETSPHTLSFNARGLPCEYSSGICTNEGFVFYFTDVRRATGWTAVSVSPAGRVKTWFWYGNSWGS